MLSKFYFLVSCSDYYFHLPSALANNSSVCHWQFRYLIDLVQELLIISFHVASYMNWPRSNCIKASRVVISGVPLITPMRKNKDGNRKKKKKKKKNQRHSLTEKRGIYYIFVKFNNAIEITRRLHPRFCDKMSVSERLMCKTPTWSKNSLKAGHTTSLVGETWLLPCLVPLLQSTLKDSL